MNETTRGPGLTIPAGCPGSVAARVRTADPRRHGQYPPPSHHLGHRPRGSPPQAVVIENVRQSIPALAGKPERFRLVAACSRVYPRARGEATGGPVTIDLSAGLSPRSRGSQGEGVHHPGLAGSIPALAGKPMRSIWSWVTTAVYPRARGEAIAAWILRPACPGLSPRSRGSPARAVGIVHQSGSIPALAGKPSRKPASPSATWVYPRARGEATRMGGPTSCSVGLSPRSRGSLRGGRWQPRLRRSIPALAGKPSVGYGRDQRDGVYPRARGEAYLRRGRGTS